VKNIAEYFKVDLNLLLKRITIF